MTFRRLKYYLYIPYYIIDLFLSLILNYLNGLNVKYLELSARIDSDKNLSRNNLKVIPTKLRLKDIKNRKMRHSFLSKELQKNLPLIR